MIECNTYEEAEKLANEISAKTKEGVTIFKMWLRSEKYEAQEMQRAVIDGFKIGEFELVTVEKFRQVYSDKFTIVENTDPWPLPMNKIIKFVHNFECPFLFTFYSQKRDYIVECSFPTVEKAEKEFNWRKELGQRNMVKHYAPTI